MTTQASERLQHDGKEFLLENHPLEIYFRLGGARQSFMVDSTMCWRGYIGTWAIEDKKLQLIKISGYIAEEPMREIASKAFRQKIDYNDRSLCRIATIDSVFPGFDAPIFAHWYSGPIEAVDIESHSIELIADVKRGQVLNLRTALVGERL